MPALLHQVVAMDSQDTFFVPAVASVGAFQHQK